MTPPLPRFSNSGNIMTFLSTLPASVQRYIHFELYQSLPPPHDSSPDMLAARNDTALLAVAQLAPVNTGEALLAIQAIASEAHARDALRGASQHHHDLDQVRRSRAQSAMMTRQAAQARKELRIAQETRWEAERQHQAETEAALREAEDSDRRADEAMLIPFMRRLAERRREETQKSHIQRQNPIARSHEIKLTEFQPSGSTGDRGAVLRVAGALPDPHELATIPRRNAIGVRR